MYTSLLRDWPLISEVTALKISARICWLLKVGNFLGTARFKHLGTIISILIRTVHCESLRLEVIGLVCFIYQLLTFFIFEAAGKLSISFLL